MKTTGIGTYILVTILILLIFGLISIGDVLSVVFYILLGFIVLVAGCLIYLQYKINRIRRQMRENGNAASSRSYTWGTRAEWRAKQDGEVTVQQTRNSAEKVVSNQVGDYVEYEDIHEEHAEETTK